MRRLATTIVFVILSWGTRNVAWGRPQFILLHPLDFTYEDTFAYGISPDGGHVAGSLDLSPNGARGYRWTSQGTPTYLGLLHDPGSAVAHAVSNGGNVVV